MESSAHNPKVTGSSPVPATKGDPSLQLMGFLFVLFCKQFELFICCFYKSKKM